MFTGIYSHAGEIRDYNITKKEWVLDGATVLYGSASELRTTLDYDFSREKNYSYKGLSMDGIIHHLAVFVARLWQIHIFSEGNTRTTAVFFIKYVRSLGFEVTNDIFAENAWYFRNSLVRANYNDLRNGIHETTEFLELFLKNLLLNERNELHNRSMHISGIFKDYQKANIEEHKVNIEEQKANIDIAEEYGNSLMNFSAKTIMHVQKMYDLFGKNRIFGRTQVQAVTGLKPTRTSELLNTLSDIKVIEPVTGHGKGKYRFR